MRSLPLIALLCLSLLPLGAAAAHPFLPAEGLDAAEVNVHPSEAAELFRESDADLLERLDREPALEAEQALEGAADQLGGAQLVVRINKRTQTMAVEVNGAVKFSDWRVSTGKAGFETRSGTFTPFEMNKNYFSRKFHVILPWGIKFDGGNLIHAASQAGQFWLGQKHSHGCVRLHPAHAKTLFEMVSRVGMHNTRVIVF